VTGGFGDGRTLAYTIAPGIKWGLALVDQEGVDEFWIKALE